MKNLLIFFIIALLAVSGCQSFKKNNNFALVVTPISLPISSEKEEVLMLVEPYYDMSLYDFLKNKKYKVDVISQDPLIYKIPAQKGLLEDLSKILITIRTAMNVISMNLANMNTTKTEDGGPYRRKALLINRDFKIEKIVGVPVDMKKVYDPRHPDADKAGYLYLPNVSEVEEKVQMMNIQRLYDDITKIIEKLNKNSVVSGYNVYY
jgi:flagellar basal-body rod protein FlgC